VPNIETKVETTEASESAAKSAAEVGVPDPTPDEAEAAIARNAKPHGGMVVNQGGVMRYID
jgi:hypothetical protein